MWWYRDKVQGDPLSLEYARAHFCRECFLSLGICIIWMGFLALSKTLCLQILQPLVSFIHLFDLPYHSFISHMWFLKAERDLGHRVTDTLIAQVRSLQSSQEARKLMMGQDWNSGFPSACTFFLPPRTHNYTWVHITDVLMCPPTHILCTSAWWPMSTRQNSWKDWATKDTFLLSLLPPWEHRNSCVSDLSSALKALPKKENETKAHCLFLLVFFISLS